MWSVRSLDKWCAEVIHTSVCYVKMGRAALVMVVFNNCIEQKSRRRDGSCWGAKKNGQSGQWRRDYRFKWAFGSSILRHVIECKLAETSFVRYEFLKLLNEMGSHLKSRLAYVFYCWTLEYSWVFSSGRNRSSSVPDCPVRMHWPRLQELVACCAVGPWW